MQVGEIQDDFYWIPGIKWNRTIDDQRSDQCKLKNMHLNSNKEHSVDSFILFQPNMDTMLDYTHADLASYRSFSHDAIRIFGFTMKHTTNGALKAKMSIKDGLR